MQSTHPQLTIEDRITLCRLFIEEGDTRSAWGEMAEMLGYFERAQEHLPADVESLYAILIIHDGIAEAEATNTER